MRSRYRIFDSAFPHFVTSTIVNWLPLFSNDQYFTLLINALKHARLQKNLQIHAYVLMKNHFHLIVSGHNWAKTLQEFKSFTAHGIIQLLKQTKQDRILSRLRILKKAWKTKSYYQVWQEGFHPQLLQDDEMFGQKMEYIHWNPVKSGYVETPEDWQYSSARNYAGMERVLDIDQWEG